MLQVEANARLLEVRKERDTLKSLNESLLQNTQAFQTQMKQAQGEADNAKAKVTELEEQVIFSHCQLHICYSKPVRQLNSAIDLCIASFNLDEARGAFQSSIDHISCLILQYTQVRDVMIFLEAREMVAGSGQELQQGSASVGSCTQA